MIIVTKVTSHPSPFYLAPDEDIKEHLQNYYKLGLTDIKVTEALKHHYDTNIYGLRYVSYFWIYDFSIIMINIISVFTV